MFVASLDDLKCGAYEDDVQGAKNENEEKYN